jgi:hypothetical protein
VDNDGNMEMLKGLFGFVSCPEYLKVNIYNSMDLLNEQLNFEN